MCIHIHRQKLQGKKPTVKNYTKNLQGTHTHTHTQRQKDQLSMRSKAD